MSISLQVPIFYPTYEEFEDFSAYITKIESLDAHKIGLAKIVPPKEWSARKLGYKQKIIEETLVENPIKQEVHGKDGFYSVYNIQQRSIKLNQFQKLTTTNRYATPTTISNNYDKLEKRYWQNLTSIAPIYGADVSGSFYDKNQKVWNINNLGTILDDLETEYGTKIEGVNTTYLYFGMWKATFAWHTEDMDLYSINYLHFGAPKQWYVIPPSYGRQFEKFAASHFPSLARRCPAFLRHKMTLISPAIIAKQSIPYSKVTQHENEFIITFPYAYHAGFNYGFNCAESTNFALQRWIEYGKHSIQCACRHDMVKIGMDRFVLKYQPELYNDWCRGINLTRHPEDEPMETTNTTIIRSSPTKRRLRNNNYTSKESINNQRQQYIYQQKIVDERYACIFRNLAKFDRLKQLSIEDYPNPHIRAALCRAQFKLNKNPTKNSMKLLCLSAQLAWNILPSSSSSSLTPIFFSGLKQANKYRENLLENLWNFQLLNEQIEQKFNQWITDRLCSCAICYLFLSIDKSENELFNLIRHLFSFKIQSDKNSFKNFFQCHQCAVQIHQDCYINICLALNVQIEDQNEEEWLCQRCILQRQSCSTILDDRCSVCLFRGGLLLNPHLSTYFIHAICAIYQAYQPSFSSSSSPSNKSCYYCWSFSPLNYRRISTHTFVPCSQSLCSNEFHVTCGLISGCTFEMNHDYSMINARCHFHAIPHQSSITQTNQQSFIDNINDQINEYLSNPFDDTEQQQQDNEEEDDDDVVAENERIPIGARVIINDTKKNKIGQVIGNEIIYHYIVDFGDGCYSDDMLAEDILDFDPLIKPLTLITGASIRIKWTDGTLYSCKYLGRKRVLLYHIQMDHEIRQMRRNEFSYDVQRSSSMLIPGQTEREHNYSRRQPLNNRTKRKKQQKKQQKQTKRKRRRILSSSSSASVEF